MTRTGSDYIEGLRDGRAVFIDGERVKDVTTHPAFSGAVRSVARVYDVANDPANRGVTTFTSPDTGEQVNVSYMIPRSAKDLAHRRKGLRLLSEQTFGLMGRSPEHVAGFLSGFAARRDVFARGGEEFADNVVAFHRFARENDVYAAYTILPPQIDRSKPAHQQADPHLYAGVTKERDDGIVIRGAQMLGTGMAIADWVQLSCIQPLRPGDEAYAISVMIPVSAPGVKVYSRRSYAAGASSTFDYPLSSRFDETDSLVVFEDVFVPWEHVFAYRNLDVTAKQWWETPGHLWGNTQAQIRFSTKLDLLVGLAHRVAEMNGVGSLPPVQGTLGELAAYASMVTGLILGAEHNCVIDEHGVAWPGQAETYASVTLQSQVYPTMITMVRDLCGGGLIQLPSSARDFRNPEIAADIARFVQSPGFPAKERVKLLKLTWDMIGSEFAGRHQQYEMFYAGAPFVVKGRMYRSFDFSRGSALVDAALAGYGLDGVADDAAGPAAPAAGA
ncbi:4-hydroxyphenylacetate 3-hydroxylase family protein [Streptomyces sp. 4N509B]|uniref:4-hydroxyphenylacetate 3-hydroxylase family protein n=1 Tax=Streptomyces sp. 4N509B TaxID=3457413 RepID=UPI003FD0E1EF